MTNAAIRKGYKQTEVGMIPADWKSIDLSDFCTLQRGFDITESTKTLGSIPVYSSSGISYYHNKAMLLPPGVVTGRKGLLGKVFMVNEPFWPHDTTLWVKDFKNNDPAFVALVLQNFHLERLDAATSVPTLNRNNLAGHKVPIPSTRAEQEAIVGVLSNADALIESLEQLIAKKRQVKQGAMQELLTGKKRLPGFSKEWIVKSLGEIGESLIGLTYKPSDVKATGVLVLRSSNIFEGGLRLEDNVFVDKNIPEKILVKSGDILICVRNGSRELIGKCTKLDERTKGMTFGAFMAVFRTPFHDFVYYQFQSDAIKRQINEHLGATINQITNKSLNAFVIPFPTDDAEQAAIASTLSDMESEISALEARLDKARGMKQGMMQQLLTGRIRLI